MTLVDAVTVFLILVAVIAAVFGIVMAATAYARRHGDCDEDG